jgi:plasmid stabilization system protein ParE
MDSRVIFHRLVQRDMDGVLRYYRDEASESVADRFFGAFLETVDKALANPQEFYFANSVYRRANIPRFPYHFLYRETSYGIRVLVLRHDRRHPDYGLRRH